MYVLWLTEQRTLWLGYLRSGNESELFNKSIVRVGTVLLTTVC